MSTRCTIHFQGRWEREGIAYVHWDGYPSGVGAELLYFLDEVGDLKDPRFDDPELLAARYVAWKAERICVHSGTDRGCIRVVYKSVDFTGVRVVTRDTPDIDYVYRVDCRKPEERPAVYYRLYHEPRERLLTWDVVEEDRDAG